MLVSSIIGGIVGVSLILSGINSYRASVPYKGLKFPRWRATLSARELGRMGARKRKERARYRWHLVATNTYLEDMETTHGPMPDHATYRLMLDKRAVLEELLYR